MAKSPAHKFGQIIGDILEKAIEPMLRDVATKHALFLDRKGPRFPLRGKRQKVTWEDKYGSSHDLDFVLEKNGSSSDQGRPVAFIECAWRSYTKHSKAKAQEIQGALLPIFDKFINDIPFIGAIIAGNFTGPSVLQLENSGFAVLYISYDHMMKAFKGIGIDAQFDEKTSEAEFARFNNQMSNLSAAKHKDLLLAIRKIEKTDLEKFVDILEARISRYLDFLTIVPLYGEEMRFDSATDAIAFSNSFQPNSGSSDFQEFFVSAVFSNGDKVEGRFKQKEKLVSFLEYVSK